MKKAHLNCLGVNHFKIYYTMENESKTYVQLFVCFE